jgi:uncharacterized protein (TIGR03000 family)
VHSHLRVRLLAASLVLGLAAVPTQAQMISKWGNPVISIGLTPYYANDLGQGNFPGGYGYTPGYGYYPGNNIPGTTYPWLTGPNVPDYRFYPNGLPRPALAPPPPPVPEIDPAAACLTVRVPDGADLRVSGVQTRQQGEMRKFVTPPLEGGRIFTYELQARWKDGGRDVARTREVNVRCGDRLTVDFLADDAAPLPPPRKVGAP